MDIAVIIALVTGVVTALAGFIVSYTQMLIKRREDLKRKKLGEELKISFSNSFKDYFSSYEAKLFNMDKPNSYIMNLRNYLVHFPNLETGKDVKELVNEKFEELKKRVEAIETRFPKEATLEKIASVNDAILATQLEAMSDSIKEIQKNILTKWDVVKILFAILGALGVIVAIIFGILNWIKS